jgi:hypothetical protein
VRNVVFEGLRLRQRSRPALVDALLSQAHIDPGQPPAPGIISVAAIQMVYRETDDPFTWIEQCQALTIAAASAGAQVLVFPASAPLALVLSLGGKDMRFAYSGQAPNAPSPTHRRGYARMYPAAYRLYHRTFSLLARRAGLTIVAGDLPAPGHAGPAHLATVFSADGRPRLRQRAVGEGQALAAAELQTTAAGGSSLAAAILEESALPWLTSTLTTTRVDLLALLPGQYSSGDANAALAAAMQGGCYVIQPYLVGGPESVTANGRSGVYAPPALTADGSGLLAQAVSTGEEEIVLAALTVNAAGRPSPQETHVGSASDGVRR